MSTDPGSRSLLERLSALLMREPHDRDELVSLLRDAEDRHILDSYSLSMIEGVLHVSDLKVRDVMIPRAKMIAISFNDKLEHFLPIVIESKHSRYPVIGEDRDEVLGILLAKDLLEFYADPTKPFNMKKYMRSAVFIPESKRLNVLLNEFRSKHNHMAIVIDEYGSVAGLVTIEDVLEQIVGEIEDESDQEEDEYHINKVDENKYTVKSITKIQEFNDYFQCKLSDKEFDTIGGLVTQQFGHLPERNETVEIGNFLFKVLHADHRRIRLLSVSLTNGTRHNNDNENKTTPIITE